MISRVSSPLTLLCSQSLLRHVWALGFVYLWTQVGRILLTLAVGILKKRWNHWERWWTLRMRIRRPSLHCILPRVTEKSLPSSFLKWRGEEIDLKKTKNLLFRNIWIGQKVHSCFSVRSYRNNNYRYTGCFWDETEKSCIPVSNFPHWLHFR